MEPIRKWLDVQWEPIAPKYYALASPARRLREYPSPKTTADVQHNQEAQPQKHEQKLPYQGAPAGPSVTDAFEGQTSESSFTDCSVLSDTLTNSVEICSQEDSDGRHYAEGAPFPVVDKAAEPLLAAPCSNKDRNTGRNRADSGTSSALLAAPENEPQRYLAGTVSSQKAMFSYNLHGDSDQNPTSFYFYPHAQVLRPFNEASYFTYPDGEVRRSLPHQKLVSETMESLGFSSFREGQKSMVYNILYGNRTLSLLKVGAGKSLSFLLVPLLTHRIAVVVSPTVSLQTDHVRNFAGKISVFQVRSKADADTDISSDLRDKYITSRRVAELEGPATLIVTPEKLCSDPECQSALGRLSAEGKLCMLVIDEAHLLLEWDSFRQDFSILPRVLNEIRMQSTRMRVSILMLSATMTNYDLHRLTSLCGFKIQTTLAGAMSMSAPRLGRYEDNYNLSDFIARFSLFAPQIFLQFVQVGVDCTKSATSGHNFDASLVRELGEERVRKIVDLLNSTNFGTVCFSKSSSIIYCRKKQSTEALSNSLNNLLHKRFCAPYHGSVERSRQQATLGQWKISELPCVCATVAFGMGINKADVRLVVDAQPSGTPHTFLQKAGRGGRDGKPALTVLYWSAEDLLKNLFLLAHSDDLSTGQREAAIYSHVAMCLLCLRRGVCKWALLVRFFNQSITSKSEEYNDRFYCGSCSVCETRKKGAQPLEGRAVMMARLWGCLYMLCSIIDERSSLLSIQEFCYVLGAPSKLNCQYSRRILMKCTDAKSVDKYMEAIDLFHKEQKHALDLTDILQLICELYMLDLITLSIHRKALKVIINKQMLSALSKLEKLIL